jgi:hypothetical protein
LFRRYFDFFFGELRGVAMDPLEFRQSACVMPAPPDVM